MSLKTKNKNKERLMPGRKRKCYRISAFKEGAGGEDAK